MRLLLDFRFRLMNTLGVRNLVHWDTRRGCFDLQHEWKNWIRKQVLKRSQCIQQYIKQQARSHSSEHQVADQRSENALISRHWLPSAWLVFLVGQYLGMRRWKFKRPSRCLSSSWSMGSLSSNALQGKVTFGSERLFAKKSFTRTCMVLMHTLCKRGCTKRVTQHFKDEPFWERFRRTPNKCDGLEHDESPVIHPRNPDPNREEKKECLWRI